MLPMPLGAFQAPQPENRTWCATRLMVTKMFKNHATLRIPAALAAVLQGLHLGTHFFCIGSAA
jgi:hypothetical protein